jgi:sec-independent protein translocase protein TatC
MSEEPEQKPEEKPEEKEKEKLAEGTLISHLLELRNRLMRALIAVIIVLIPCAAKSNWLFNLVSLPIRHRLPASDHLIATGVMAPFMTPFTVSIYVALFLAMPYVLYQVWAFVAPGLYRYEKRFAVPLLVSSIVLFYCGMAFAYFVVFPVVFRFFALTTPEGVTWNADITNYVNFVMKMFLAFGLAFETPVAVVLLVITGLVKLEKLQRNRGYVLIVVTVIAGAVTPSDAISMCIMAGPMYLLYEVGLLFARMCLKMQRRQEAEKKDQEG